MFNRVSAFFIAIITFLTGSVLPQATNIVDTFAQAVFGVPFTSNSIGRDFIEQIDVGNIDFADCEDVGIIGNMVLVFLDDDISFKDKCSFVSQSGGLLSGWYSAADLYILKFSRLTTEDIENKCAQIMQLDNVVLALPCLAHKYSPDETPNDPFNGDSSWNELIPQGNNWWLEAIGAREAWDYSYYFGEVNVGVIDAGFQTDHPDLIGKISFPSEKLQSANRPNDHGTHVSGIIAAEKNNGVGIAGVCPHAKLICVDWEPDAGQIWVPDVKIIFGFIDAVRAGAKVCNFSLGSSSSIREERTERSGIYNWWDAKIHSLVMSSLLSDGYDFLVVQSAGNGNEAGRAVDASQNGSFCAINSSNVTTGSYSGVTGTDILSRIVIVAAAENDGDGTFTLAPFSNVGNTVTLAAPGANIYSCYTESEWNYMSGTSMSAPIVTGVAALVWSVNPDFTGAEVKSIITDANSTCRLADNRNDYYFDDLDYRSIALVNAQFAVEEAISRAHDVGRIAVCVIDANDNPISSYATVNETNGAVTRHTALDNGQLEFVTAVGAKTLNVYDENDILIYTSSSVTVSKDATTNLGIIKL